MRIKDLKEGTAVELTSLEKTEHATQPPGNFRENTLIAALEKMGIGRPSTFSSIVDVIQQRKYVRKDRGRLIPTPLGFAIVALLTNKFPKYTDYEYTADMEEEIDKIAEGKTTREKFLNNFWFGDEEEGFGEFVKNLMNNIDWEEIKELSTLDLENGYSITYNKFGAFLQDNNGKPNAKGYLPSAKLDDDVDVFTLKDPAECKKLIEKASRGNASNELGVLESGEYKGWTVTAREGRYGAYLQGQHPKHIEALEAGKKPGKNVPNPVNHKLPKEHKVDTVTLKDISGMFEEVRLPRWSQDKLFLTGRGKKGNYIGRKSSPKARPQFKSLPEEHDPRTISFEKVKELWEEL